MAVLDMVESIRSAWERVDACLGILIDFKKAFDTVDHFVLLSKMEHMGIRGAPLELIRSHLNNRRQYVVFNGANQTKSMSLWVSHKAVYWGLYFFFFILTTSQGPLPSLSAFCLQMIPIFLHPVKIEESCMLK